ncbi:Ig-like domain-containing protein, partial [Parvularcula maris]|nr:Ig-like domain-containing protein [Parvularcula maris]
MAAVFDRAGNTYAGAEVVASFVTKDTIDLIRPRVSLTDPRDEQRGLATDIFARVAFDEPVDPVSVSSSTVTLYDYSRGRNITTDISLSDDRLLLNLQPIDVLLPLGR